MPNWTKNKGYTQNPQVGQWQSPPFNAKPPLDKSISTVPPWEKKFCYSVGSVPWQNVVECKRYMYMHPNVNDSQGWYQREKYGGGLHNKYQGRNDGSGNWGTSDGYNRKTENNMSWSMNSGYHHGTNDYQMNRGRGRRNGGRGGGGGRRGNFGYADKVVTSRAWLDLFQKHLGDVDLYGRFEILCSCSFATLRIGLIKTEDKVKS
ncbi:hypothetical protein TSUD_330770 [Trifolium subterraneum]|nr:hypothetical protein TSUD_330770 [Trifolium subterraneum]